MQSYAIICTVQAPPQGQAKSNALGDGGLERVRPCCQISPLRDGGGQLYQDPSDLLIEGLKGLAPAHSATAGISPSSGCFSHPVGFGRRDGCQSMNIDDDLINLRHLV